MESFCPLCAKSGIRRRVKAFQINLEEAVWACEAEECSWPIGYKELIFFNRAATSCNWDEPSPIKEDMLALMELSLYTPPVTPGGELSKELAEIASTEYSSNPPAENKAGTLPQYESIVSKESTDSNKSPLFEILEIGSVNSTEENRSVINEQIADVNMFRTLPKITNVEKTNINLTILSNIGGYYDNTKIQEHEHSLMNTPIMDTFNNLDISDSVCTELGLNMQFNTGGEQSGSDKLQLDATVSGVEMNLDAKISETVETLVDIDVTNSSNATNEHSIENISNSDINTLLEDIFNNESQIPLDINISDDWLSRLMS